MPDLDSLLERLRELLADLEALDEPVRMRVFEFLDGFETVHRTAVHRLAEILGDDGVERVRGSDPAVAWLLEAYGVGVDERAEAEAALTGIRPYIDSHGGTIELLDAADGVVRIRLAGSCSGCSASAVTLQRGVEEALREGMPGFRALEVEQEDAPAHPPPGATLLEIENRLA